MATMYPEEFPPEKRPNPKFSGEALFYDECTTLPDEYRVFYHINWIAGKNRRHQEEGEGDFAILHPRHGLLFLEVKGGGIRFDRAKDTWISTNRDELENRIRNPHEQISETRRIVTSFLAKHFKLRRPIWAAIGLVFPHIHINHDLLNAQNWPREMVIFEGDLDNLESAIERVFAFRGSEGGHTAFSSLNEAQTRGVERLWSHGDCRSVLASYLRQDAWAIQRLTEDQTRILDGTRNFSRLAVKGGAGTGKTVLALEKATRLAQQGTRTLLTCRNALLANHLKLMVDELPDPRPTILDFRELCIQFGLNSGALVERPSNPLEKRWTTFLPEILLQSIEGSDFEPFDAIIVDEGQDFSSEWWTPLELLLRNGDESTFWIFYDDNQQYFQRHEDFPNLQEFSLDENLRNTRAIFDVFRPFYPGTSYTPRGPEGQPVKIALIDDSTEMLKVLSRRLHDLVNVEKVRFRDITILTGSSLSPSMAKRSALLGREKVGNFRLTNSYPPADGHILVQDVLSFKGMESTIVILVEIDDLLHDDKTLYVGLSRAKVHLEVIGTEKTCEFIRAGKLKLYNN